MSKFRAAAQASSTYGICQIGVRDHKRYGHPNNGLIKIAITYTPSGNRIINYHISNSFFIRNSSTTISECLHHLGTTLLSVTRHSVARYSAPPSSPSAISCLRHVTHSRRMSIANTGTRAVLATLHHTLSTYNQSTTQPTSSHLTSPTSIATRSTHEHTAPSTTSTIPASSVAVAPTTSTPRTSYNLAPPAFPNR